MGVGIMGFGTIAYIDTESFEASLARLDGSFQEESCTRLIKLAPRRHSADKAILSSISTGGCILD